MTENRKPYVIVAAVDYTDAGDLALARALEEATRCPSAALHVIHVLPVYQAGSMQPSAAGFEAPPVVATALPSVSDAAEHLRKYTEQALAAFREQRAGDNLASLEQIVVHQRVDVPSEEIGRLAGEVEADLVVVGTHGRSGISRFLLGSVAEATVRLAPCPVLVMRPKTAPAPVPAIEPPCARCVEARETSNGQELWCEQHRERHGQRHTYNQRDRGSEETNLPLLVRG